MSGIVAIARQWLAGEKSPASGAAITHQQIIESLLSEIQRVGVLNSSLAGEIQRLETDGAKEIRLATAEECAVICETADYVVRSYGCAREIRKKFGLPTQKG